MEERAEARVVRPTHLQNEQALTARLHTVGVPPLGADEGRARAAGHSKTHGAPPALAALVDCDFSVAGAVGSRK